MRALIREPLLHFVLLGAALFAFDSLRTERSQGAAAGEIVVSGGRIQNLAALFAMVRQRPPTAAELRGLVDDFVLEEALYREGVALGVDQNDTIIRRRVRQKMEFVLNDIVDLAEPTEEQLEQWLATHRATYTRPGRFRFRQLFLDPRRHGDSLAADAAQILVELRAADPSLDPRPLGDLSLLEHAYPDEPADVLARSFGADFASELGRAPVGEWSGPIESAYGLHLVFVDQHQVGELPELDSVRAEVSRDWAYARREAATEEFYEQLLERYDVQVEWPDPERQGKR